MMKNKGIIGLGLVLAIILGVVVVGGGAYYLGKNKEEKTSENILPVGEEQNLPAGKDSQKVCNKNSPSFIKVLSPNGGEVFNAGDKITVKWESCNVDPGSIGIVLIRHDKLSSHTREQEINDYAGFTLGGFDGFNGTEDDGIQELTLPNNSDPNLVSGPYYTIVVMGTGDVTNIGSGYNPRDYSDDWFTINYEAKDVSVAAWKEYSNSEYGFRFNYPGDWKLTEDKIKKEVTIDTNDIGDVVEGGTFPLWRITFKSTDKTFFNNLQPTKMGVITYNEKESAVFADDRCIKGTKLLGGLIQAFTYGGSLMSDPAYWNSAILTKNGTIIIVNSYQGGVMTPKLEKQLSTIGNTFKLLNDNSFFVPECSK